MKKADVLIKNAYVLTMNETREIKKDVCIAVTGDRIEEIGGMDLMTAYEAGRVIDAGGKVVLPGFISTHTHLFQTMLKGLGRDMALIDWLDSSVRVALHNFDEETIYYAALLGCMEGIKSGTTTILDYMYCHVIPGLDEQVIRAFEDIGIRGILGRSYTDVSGFPKETACQLVEKEQDFLDETVRLTKALRGNPRITTALAPGAIWDHTDDGFREMRKIADAYKILITLHLVESGTDDEFSLGYSGEKAIPHLEKLGVFGPDFLAVHCVRMAEDDFALFKAHDVKVSHNPLSNMILASGVPPITRFLEEGITVSLACDGSASNDCQNMIEAIKIASLMQKVYTRDPLAVPAAKSLEMATVDGAKAIGRERDLGSVEAGKKADLIFYDPHTAFTAPVHDPVASLVFASTPESITDAMVAGVMVMEDRRMTTVDEEKVIAEADRCARRLVEKSGLGNTQWGQRVPFV